MTSIALAAITVGTIGVSAVSGTITANADSNDSTTTAPAKGSLADLMNQTWGPQNGQNTSSNGDIANVDVDSLSSAQREDMIKLIEQHSVETKSGDDTTVMVANSALVGAYDSVTTGKPFSENRAYHGSSKIVWHGPAKKGNFDLYISQSILGGAYGVQAAVHLIGILVEGAGDNVIGAVKQMKSAIVSTVKGGSLKAGLHFVVRHWHAHKA